ncbi:hypothetical protein ACIB24_07590 [Spongisporangium articulatum]|uniref:Secreted protein n=1 Tax=Spongisporangium articulatum TaxID=3362603 RepID=A0ABW8AMS5_9ACTN
MRRRAAVLAAALVGALLAAGATPAAGDEVDPGGAATRAGYTVGVTVHFSGDAAPAASRTVRVRPTCWWMPADGPYTDAAAMLKWYDGRVGASFNRDDLTTYGPRNQWVAARDKEKAGGDISWYKAYCTKPEYYAKYHMGSYASTLDQDFGGATQTWLVNYYKAFNVGEAVPPPVIDPAELARAARDEMVIPVPVTDRNPKVKAAGAPTLVGLPTWFWVTNPAAVGGPAGTRTIRAEVGGVWAEVTAKTAGLKLASPAGGVTCPPARATVKYGPGVNVDAACTVSFDRASVAYPKGYPVVASTGWQATWVGSDGGDGVLVPLARQAVANVPVAEVQNVVTR